MMRKASEVRLIPVSELELLRSFNSHGHITLTAYLLVDSARVGDSVYEGFFREMQASLDRCKAQPECRQAIKEDAEIVALYLKTNGHRRHAAVAIFSCAAELFWRAYPLVVPVRPQVSVGPKFDLDPLLRLSGRPNTP
jgi:hypothetical protein